jgi:hypothetical protein
MLIVKFALASFSQQVSVLLGYSSFHGKMQAGERKVN